jgi:hypothetical protein
VDPKTGLDAVEMRKSVLMLEYGIKQIMWIGHIGRREMHTEFWRGNLFWRVVKY